MWPERRLELRKSRLRRCNLERDDGMGPVRSLDESRRSVRCERRPSEAGTGPVSRFRLVKSRTRR